GLQGVPYALPSGGRQGTGMRAGLGRSEDPRLGGPSRLGEHRPLGAELPIEPCAADAQGGTGGLHPHYGGERGGGLHQDGGGSALGSVRPKSAETFFWMSMTASA